ncbi:MAG: SusD/RagB family nutrient-binding outer membrane lipoprotein [Hymenobacter sp.]|nr:MAG: SusD/RagB family nutrient-binding outer membrane lipoprotein [Hymenobacter sp.]
MKSKKLLGITLAYALVFSTISCSKDKLLDINNTPNSPTSVTMPVLFTGTLAATGFMATNDLGRTGSLLIQHSAGIANQPAAYDVYILRGSFDNQWNGELYGGALVNSQLLIDLAVTQSSPAYSGVAKLIKAYNFSVVTDLYGDVPYSQALQGIANAHPRYDKQEDIYKGNTSLGIQGLIALVQDGLADLDRTSATKPGLGDDLAYGKTTNNIAQWKKMGNTLLLKFANTISKKEPALAATLINQAATGAFTSNADDFEIPFGTATGNLNPLYNYNFVTRPDDQMLSQTLLNAMASRNDPRLPIYFNTTQPVTGTVNTTGTTTSVGTFTGYINGNTAPVPARVPVAANPALTNRSRYNTYIRGASGEAPARLLTNFQRLFILAESVLTLPGITATGAATAQSLYQDAIRASMTKAGITDAAVTAYLSANPSVAILSTNQAQALSQIITQKWIAWVGNGIEPYNDYRRTTYPTLAPALNASGDDNTLPQRFPYPLSELTANAGAENQNVNLRTSAKVWWAN